MVSKVNDFSVCMKKIITVGSFFVTFFVLFIVCGTQSSCHKENTNCTAVVTVLDSAGANPISGCAVKLYAPHGQVQGNGTTNAAGTVSFTFTLPAIFNISATKGLGQLDTLKGSGIIQLQIGSTVSATVNVHH